jgi:hypothetical protein
MVSFFLILFFLDDCLITLDFKAKETIPISFDQVSTSYYTHLEIPFLILVAQFLHENRTIKRIFVVTSKSIKQDVSFVIDSVNYVLSLKIFQNFKTIYIISDNAKNLKNGFDIFNIFSDNGPHGDNKITFIRLNSWFN